jgi:hypothetical protein
MTHEGGLETEALCFALYGYDAIRSRFRWLQAQTRRLEMTSVDELWSLHKKIQSVFNEIERRREAARASAWPSSKGGLKTNQSRVNPVRKLVLNIAIQKGLRRLRLDPITLGGCTTKVGTEL